MSETSGNLPAEKLMAWLDGELSEEEARAFEELLEKHPEWRAEADSMAALVQATDRLQLLSPSPQAWDHYWEEIDDRIARRFGWSLLSAGSLLLIALGIWKVMHHTEDPWVKSGVVLVILGVMVLLGGVIKGRMAELPHDRYRRIKR